MYYMYILTTMPLRQALHYSEHIHVCTCTVTLHSRCGQWVWLYTNIISVQLNVHVQARNALKFATFDSYMYMCR